MKINLRNLSYGALQLMSWTLARASKLRHGLPKHLTMVRIGENIKISCYGLEPSERVRFCNALEQKKYFDPSSERSYIWVVDCEEEASQDEIEPILILTTRIIAIRVRCERCEQIKRFDFKDGNQKELMCSSCGLTYKNR